MQKWRIVVTLSLVGVLACALPARAGTGPDLACVTATPALPGGPSGSVAPVDAVREDPGGWTTVTVLVEDPIDGADRYELTPAAADATTGAFVHPWPGNPSIVTIGRYDGVQRVRMPLLVLESTEDQDLERLLIVIAQAQFATLANLEPLLLELLLPATGTFEYPDSLAAYRDVAPFFIWTVERAGLWAGFVHTQSGASREIDNTESRIVQACRREHMVAVLRSDGTTTVAGGIFIDDVVDGGVVDGRFTATQTITSGTSAAGTDVPITTLHGDHTSFGGWRQSDLTVGVVVDGERMPLIGVRSTMVRAAFPEGENRLISIGVYGRNDDYHPQAGVRYHVEHALLEWIDSLISEGLGAQSGDLETDVGTFDAYGRFVPLAGATYDDSLDEAGREFTTGISGRGAAQALITTGTWQATGVALDGQRPSLLQRYVPQAGISYDGDLPLLAWERLWVNDALANERWLVSAGAFTPDAYVPAAGIEHANARADGVVVERVRAGTFAGSYDAFTPVAEARWTSDRSALAWTLDTTFTEGAAAASDARLDIGAVAPGGEFVPVAGITAEAGEVEHYGIGAWVGSSFVELLAACLGLGHWGVRAAGIPLLWIGVQGTTITHGALEDCPS